VTVAEVFTMPMGWYVINILANWWNPLPVFNQEDDRFHWLPHPSGHFSSAFAWELIRPKGNAVT